MINSLVTKYEKLCNFYFIVLIIGFIFISTVPKVIGLTESSLSVAYRLFILLFSIFIIYLSLNKNFSNLSFKNYYLFTFFWLIYSIRLINDLFINPIKLYPEKSSTEYLLFAYGIVLIPCIAIIVVLQSFKINYKKILFWVYNILIVCMISAIFYRNLTGSTGRSAGDVNVGILLFGQFGTSLALLSIYQLIFFKTNVYLKSYYLLGFFVGVISIFISASKSPLLALFLVLMFLLYVRYGFLKTTLVFSTSIIFLGNYFISFFGKLSTNLESNIFSRILKVIDTGGDKAREKLYSLGINSFIDNPFFGKAFLIQNEGYLGIYPHNIIIESFMALGFLGGFCILFLIAKGLFNAYYSISKKHDFAWIGLLFLQFLIFGMFSNNIFSNDMFWYFLVIILYYNKSFLINKN